MYFTNPSKISYTFASTDGWVVIFSDKDFNIITSASGIPIFPASDVSFKELGSQNAPLNVGINSALDLGTPNVVQYPFKIEITFIDDEKQTINTLIRDWILSSPVYKSSRVINFHKDSTHTKTVHIYKLDKSGNKLSHYGKKDFTVFPSGDLVQLFNSDPSARVDKFELRCY